MAFLDDESGSETSQPREGIEIILPAVTYRIATGTRNVVIGGATYTASAIGRGEASIESSADHADMLVRIPVAHAVAQRYLANGVPPNTIVVKLWRQQTASGEAELHASGEVTSMAVEGHYATLLVPSRIGLAVARRLPTITAGRLCAHVLFDDSCTVSRASFVLGTTASFVDGRTVHCVEPYPDDFATYGEVLHVSTGERSSIMVQTTTGATDVRITMQTPIPGLAFGDAIEIYAGCGHTIGDCRTKFSNVPNFGGQPSLPLEVLHFTAWFGKDS